MTVLYFDPPAASSQAATPPCTTPPPLYTLLGSPGRGLVWAVASPALTPPPNCGARSGTMRTWRVMVLVVVVAMVLLAIPVADTHD